MEAKPTVSRYEQAGVSIDAGNRAIDLMRQAVRTTYGPEVIAGIGAFGGLYDATWLCELTSPVLVASTDGAGTKTRIAAALARFDSIGHDIVNHCVNDILVQGAKPLFFLDYIAASTIEPGMVATAVGGIAAACRAVSCALLGGETAEMPGVYAAGEFDLVGTIVGAVDRAQIIDGHSIQVGDALLGLASTGLHTNGYSLARQVFSDVPLTHTFRELGRPLGEVLLEPHRSYLDPVNRLRAQVPLKGLVHVTGGGLVENLPRVLPEGVGAEVWPGSWPEAPIFRLLAERGRIDPTEMAHVFNLGIGMVAVVDAGHVAAAQAALDEPSWVIGQILPADDGPRIRFTR